jgi:hypothetical protein
MLLKQCIAAYQGFQKLSNLALPLKSSWAIAQNISKLAPPVESFEASRKKYVEQLKSSANLGENGEPEVTEALAAEFREQVEALLEENVSIKLKKVVLDGAADLSIEPSVLMEIIDYVTVK